MTDKTSSDQFMGYPRLASYEVVYWGCGRCKKKHKTKSGAQLCIDKSERAKRAPIAFRWTAAVLGDCITRSARGESFASIGRSYGKSAMTIRLRTASFMRDADCDYGGEPVTRDTDIRCCGLMTALKNNLLQLGVKRVRDLSRFTENDLRREPNIGEVSIREIRRLALETKVELKK